MVNQIAETAHSLGYSYEIMPSGAGHDAMGTESQKKGGFMAYQNTPKMYRTLSQHAPIHDAQT